MKLPNIAYEAELDITGKYISFFERKISSDYDQKRKRIKLPKWLAKLIKQVSEEYEEHTCL